MIGNVMSSSTPPFGTSLPSSARNAPLCHPWATCCQLRPRLGCHRCPRHSRCCHVTVQCRHAEWCCPAQIAPMWVGRHCQGADGTTIECHRVGGRRRTRHACSPGFGGHRSSIRSGGSTAAGRRCRRISEI
jgi:hypothetical protein